MTAPEAIDQAAGALIEAARQHGVMVATAESCTGGLIAGAITAVAGSSDVFACGFVTYSNEAKTRLLAVPAALITDKGAVSREVAEAMVEGALEAGNCGLACAVTGIAGPGGGSATKPVGLVHIAAGTDRRLLHREYRFGEIGRAEVRQASVLAALQLALAALDSDAPEPPP